MKKNATFVALCALCLLGVPAGCKKKDAQATSATAPLKVWVVLAPGESMGGQDNCGCRLSLAQIRQRIQHLQNNSGIFGQNVTFQWTPNTPDVIFDPSINCSNRTRAFESWYQPIVLNNWTDGRINIYFVGNVQFQGDPPNAIIATTLDPKDVASIEPQGLFEESLILINDGAYGPPVGPGFGFVHTPTQVLDWNILEHEMTHFLARFKNRTFGQAPNQRVYFGDEHIAQGSNNILTPGIVSNQPHPLVIPGGANQTGTEKAETWDRLRTGQWQDP